jgi:hypothetical protein
MKHHNIPVNKRPVPIVVIEFAVVLRVLLQLLKDRATHGHGTRAKDLRKVRVTAKVDHLDSPPQ